MAYLLDRSVSEDIDHFLLGELYRLIETRADADSIISRVTALIKNPAFLQELLSVQSNDGILKRLIMIGDMQSLRFLLERIKPNLELCSLLLVYAMEQSKIKTFMEAIITVPDESIEREAKLCIIRKFIEVGIAGSIEPVDDHDLPQIRKKEDAICDAVYNILCHAYLNNKTQDKTYAERIEENEALVVLRDKDASDIIVNLLNMIDSSLCSSMSVIQNTSHQYK